MPSEFRLIRRQDMSKTMQEIDRLFDGFNLETLLA
jgi:hypothetical protein